MKMIRRTRSTSISGVTLISETALRTPLLLPIPITTSLVRGRARSGRQEAYWLASYGLLPCFNARSDEADVVDFSLVTHINHFGYLVEVKVFIPLDEHNLLLPCGKNLSQLGLEGPSTTDLVSAPLIARHPWCRPRCGSP